MKIKTIFSFSSLGFTLVELLVVIAIIGILSSVAIVNLQSARQKAKAASVQATLSQLTSAIVLCADEYSATNDTNLTYSGSNSCASGGVLQAPVAGQKICPGSSAFWPDVAANNSGFIYAPFCASAFSTSAAPTWVFLACEGSAGSCKLSPFKEVYCTQTGCQILQL